MKLSSKTPTMGAGSTARLRATANHLQAHAATEEPLLAAALAGGGRSHGPES